MHNETGVYTLEIFIEQWSHDKLGGNFRSRLYEFLEHEIGIARESTTAHKILNDVFCTYAPAYLSYFPVETGKKEPILWYFLLALATKLVLIQWADTDADDPLSLWETALSKVKLSDAEKRAVQHYSVKWEQIQYALSEFSEYLPAESLDWLFSDLHDLCGLKADSDRSQEYERLMQEELTNLLVGATNG